MAARTPPSSRRTLPEGYPPLPVVEHPKGVPYLDRFSAFFLIAAMGLTEIGAKFALFNEGISIMRPAGSDSSLLYSLAVKTYQVSQRWNHELSKYDIDALVEPFCYGVTVINPKHSENETLYKLVEFAFYNIRQTYKHSAGGSTPIQRANEMNTFIDEMKKIRKGEDAQCDEAAFTPHWTKERVLSCIQELNNGYTTAILKTDNAQSSIDFILSMINVVAKERMEAAAKTMSQI